jgi:hypothetical protein
VSLTVSDGRGGSFTQSFTLPVETAVTNDAPSITSSPPSPAIAGRQYVYQIKASDPNGDLLTYELIAGPPGMTVEYPTGRLTWLPTAADAPPITASVIVRDGRGGYATQTMTVPVVVDAPLERRRRSRPRRPVRLSMATRTSILSRPAIPTATRCATSWTARPAA